MALTYTTGMTLASAADSATNWTINRIAGSGQAPAFGGSDATVFREGTASNSSKISVANTDAVHILDWYTNTEGGKSTNTTINLTTEGNEVVGFWVNLTTIAAVRTQANGGLYLLISSSTEAVTSPPTVYSKWYIGGSDNYAGGWQFFMVDTRKAASITAGGGCDLTIVRRMGVGVFLQGTPGTIKADNLFVDAMWYGRPRYQVVGDGSTIATWALMLADSVSKANGLIEDIGGAYKVSSGLRLGSGTQGATTSFTDATGRLLLFKRYTYHNATSVVDSLNYSDYYVFDANGAASFKTAINIGSVVGTGDNRQGVLGGGISSPDTTNLTWSADFSTNKANLSAVKLSGFNWFGAKGGILFDNNTGGTESILVSNSFVNCGEVRAGTTGSGAEIINCSVIDPLGGTATNRGLRINATTRIKRISCITSGTPTTQHLTHIADGGTISVPYDAVRFFGDYASGTLWHGEASANNSGTITINASNLANPEATEFNKTGTPAATVAVSNPIVLNIDIVDDTGTLITSNCEVTIVRNSDTVILFEEDGIVDGQTTYNYNSGGGTVVYVNILNVTGYQAKTVNNYTLPSSGTTTLVVQLDADPFYSNP